jgi:excinuclease ABC subunit C
VTKQDDVASIKEVVSRRYKRLIKEKTQLPDLIIIDGGIGQINAAQTAIKSLALKIPIISLAKKNEEIYFPNLLTPIQLNKNKKIMLFLRKIRDTAHNYSIRYNRKRREMKSRVQFKS